MEGSEHSKIENSRKEMINDGSQQVEVEEVDFGEVIELPPEPVAKQDGPATIAEEKNTLEQSGSYEATVEEKEVEKLSVVPVPEAPVKDLVSSEYEQKHAVASETETKTSEDAALPISDTSVVESSGVADSTSKENVVDSSEPIADTPVDATNGGGDRDLSENLSSIDRQPAAVITPHRRASWTSCCGLFDALRGSNQ